MKNKKSQGVVESVVAVGILMAVLTGTVLLISFGLSNRKVGFDRRKANELATLVMEEQVSESVSSPEEFWQLTNISVTNNPNFSGYNYQVDFTNIFADANYPNCGVGRTDCAKVVVNIGWSGKETQNLKFDRFFSR